MDIQETRRAVSAIKVVGKIDGHDVIRRTSAIDVVRQREERIEALWNALLKSCGDNADMANELIASQMR